MYKRLDRYIKPGKKPGKFVGIELEILSKCPNAILEWEFNKAGLADYINVGNDGSIRTETGYPYTAEIRVLCPQDRFIDIMNTVCDILNTLGCKANKSCGLHVHLDMRGTTKRNVKVAYRDLVDSLPELKTLVAKHRVTPTSYNKLNKTNNFTYALKGIPIINYEQKYAVDGTPLYDKKGKPIVEKVRRFGEREPRAAINPHAYSEHKTLEVRMKEGTIDKDEIVKWVNKLVDIVDNPKEEKAS